MSQMEVEDEQQHVSTPAVSPLASGKISVHPLSIVNMSDQYTRITCGGSPLDSRAPVVGLLFGTCCQQRKQKDNDNDNDDDEFYDHLEILDADDIPTDLSDAAARQVSLHHAVFTQQQVVGWYRVATPSDHTTGNNSFSLQPTENDLQCTQQLQDHYTQQFKQGDQPQPQPPPPPPPPQQQQQQQKQQPPRRRPFVFGLLQVEQLQHQQHGKDTKERQEQEQEEQEEQMATTAEVPFHLYEVATIQNTHVLMGLENWTLQTSEPERIAVERVIREQPVQLNHLKKKHNKKHTKTTTTSPTKIQQQGQQQPPPQQESLDHQDDRFHHLPSSQYVTYMTSVQHSLEAMKDRIQICIDFLQKTQSGQIPPNYALMRHVHGLVLQLGSLDSHHSSPSSSSSSNNNSTILLSNLAAISKTIHSVQMYTEKFKFVYENRYPMGGGPGGGPPGPSSSSSRGDRHGPTGDARFIVSSTS